MFVNIYKTLVQLCNTFVVNWLLLGSYMMQKKEHCFRLFKKDQLKFLFYFISHLLIYF